MDNLERQLRPLLTPITHNLPAPLQNLGQQIIGDVCYRSLVHNITISDTVCLKLAISKALGVGIVAASSIVKIPQLLKILNSQSAEGVSFLSYLLETSSFLITLVYNIRNGFPFSTYGEIALIAVQNIAISILVLNYTGRSPVAVLYLASLAAAFYALQNDSITSASNLQYLQAFAGLLGVSSKLPQIYAIAKEGGTGQLSAFAVSETPNYTVPLLTEAGLQLSCWFGQPNLHHFARSARQAYSWWLHSRCSTQRYSSSSDAVLLECSYKQVNHQSQAQSVRSQCSQARSSTCDWIGEAVKS